jgi:hypothetical protein
MRSAPEVSSSALDFPPGPVVAMVRRRRAAGFFVDPANITETVDESGDSIGGF